MKYEIGDIVKVSKITLPEAQDEPWWIGRVGKITKFEKGQICLKFDFDLIENERLNKFMTSPNDSVYFLDEELELYIPDINILD